MNRRVFLRNSAVLAGAVSASPLALAKNDTSSAAHVVVVGAGYGGGTVARYIRALSNGSIKVTVIEPNRAFVSCPLSNLVIGGSQNIETLTTSYNGLIKDTGIQLINDHVTQVNADKKTVTTSGGTTLRFDKLVLAAGIGMDFAAIEGLAQANAAGVTLQAWKAGPETVALHKQLAEMPDGGVFALTIPLAPYRCPPGPYERTCQVASYLKQHKPKSKIVVFDANEDVTSKGKLFKQVWEEQYKGLIDYRPQHRVVGVDAKTRTLKFELADDFKADVLNVLPPMHAGEIVRTAGLANVNNRWAAVKFLNFESALAKDIHVIGDSIQVAPGMPKSGHMANQHAKVTAAAIVCELKDLEINPQPVVTNTCYSFVNATDVVHVASVHQYDAQEATFKMVPGSGGLSPAPTSLEGRYAWGWARNIWNDTIGT